MSKKFASSAAVAGPGEPDAPTAADYRRMRIAQRKARTHFGAIEVARAEALLEAFRAEIGAAVRSASPLFEPMFAIEGITLDEAVAMLEPRIGWPGRPRPSGPKGRRSVHTHLLRHYLAGLTPTSQRRPTQVSSHSLVGRRFDRVNGGYLRLEVVDHSLEIDAQVGPVCIRTRFGELRVELGFEMPQTMFVACVGRLIEEIVDYEVWRGLGWRIAAIEGGGEHLGQTLVVVTGSVPYRMPWMR